MPTPPTHTPYRVKRNGDNIEIIDDQYNTVAKMVWYPDALDEKTAREFVNAMNCHEELLKAVKTMHGIWHKCESNCTIVEAIARAEGKQ